MGVFFCAKVLYHDLMGTIITARKVRLAEAIQINSPEEEETVLQWIREEIETQTGEQLDENFTVDLEELKEAHVYFMRDHGSSIVYITPPADFLSFFEEVSEEELKNINDPFKF